MTLNGNVVATENINSQAVSIVSTYSSTYQPGILAYTNLSFTFGIPVSMPKSGNISIVCAVQNRGIFGDSPFSTSAASITGGNSFSGGGVLAGISFTLISEGAYSAGSYTFNVDCTDVQVYNPGWTVTAIIIRTFR
jgi:hypothetical protein